MAPDDDGDDELAGFGDPPAPSDRLWRHPSELAASPLREPPTERRRSLRRPSPLGVALLAGATGAALCGGFLALTGRLGDGGERQVTEKVASAPVISFPILTEGADVAALAERLAPAIVRLHSTSGEETLEASGVVIHDDGVVLTSAIAVDGWRSVTVVLAGGRRLPGEIVGADLPTDVAVVTVDGQKLPVAVLGVTDGLIVGAPTVALGAAEAGGEHPGVATGVVSAVSSRLDIDGQSLHGMIQTDAPVSAAWAGGPLVDATGAVIGITSGLIDESANVGHATPIGLARRVAEQLLADGHATHAWLGVESRDVVEDDDEAGRGGAEVVAVDAQGPAADSELAVGDVIEALDGDAVRSSSDLVVSLRAHAPGDEVVVRYRRGGRTTTTTIVCGERS